MVEVHLVQVNPVFRLGQVEDSSSNVGEENGRV
jgi:hypothetical protein